MLLISQSISENLAGGSWIRRMFEAGILLKKEFGEDNVCDFSLGNPDLAPPVEVAIALRDLASKLDQPFSLGYMPNGGAPWAREIIATEVSTSHGIEVQAGDVMLSCGAAGALNSFLKATLDPGDEVLTTAPYFVEYGSYVSNHGGVFTVVPSIPDTFTLDIAAIEAAITPKTRAFIVNSPHNPTGQVYSKDELQQLVDLLGAYSKKNKRPIFLISDEPYRFLVYDGVEVPSLLPLYKYAVTVNSFSKSLCIPGERVGYLAVSPLLEGREQLIAACTLANRILGFVNPPAVGQHILKFASHVQVDVSIYLERRNAMAQMLTDAGYDFLLPKGAFYFFPKAPGGDDIAFVDTLRKERILAVPGTGFGAPGYFRLAFCVDKKIILRAAEGFKKAN